MIHIDHYRCTYCGGCVNVCPVEALTLAETRLVVNADCLGCGDCATACPVGALRLESAEPTGQGDPFGRRYDVVVVGAGPGGATAAQVAAQAGLSVLLLEKRQEIGSPVRCAEGVGHEQLTPFIEPDPRWIAAQVNQAEITTVVDGETRTVRASGLGRAMVDASRVAEVVTGGRRPPGLPARLDRADRPAVADGTAGAVELVDEPAGVEGGDDTQVPDVVAGDVLDHGWVSFRVRSRVRPRRPGSPTSRRRRRGSRR